MDLDNLILGQILGEMSFMSSTDAQMSVQLGTVDELGTGPASNEMTISRVTTWDRTEE
jgi:hypothetical protein